MKAPTPETDAEAMRDYVLADFARKLEQERDKARALFQSSERARADLAYTLAKEVSENEDMREAIRQANERLLGLEDHLTKNHGLFLLDALAKLQPFLN
jgi:hypothetical protein